MGFGLALILLEGVTGDAQHLAGLLSVGGLTANQTADGDGALNQLEVGSLDDLGQLDVVFQTDAQAVGAEGQTGQQHGQVSGADTGDAPGAVLGQVAVEVLKVLHGAVHGAQNAHDELEVAGGLEQGLMSYSIATLPASTRNSGLFSKMPPRAQLKVPQS